MYKVLIISGPTAGGKSTLAVELAKKYNGEIISGDSVQVYKELNIGSAKIKEEEMQGVKHHLIDVLSYKENYSVYDFQRNGREAIEEIIAKNNLPIIVGGTGLYIKALLYDYQFPQESDKEDDYQALDNEALYQMIKDKDEEAALKLHVNNRKRLIRTLKLMEALPDNKTSFLADQTHQPLYDILIIGLDIERPLLHERINERVEQMWDNGLVKEVEELYAKDKDLFSYQALQAIGYREFEAYFSQESSLEEVKEKIKSHTRQFAKRQYTWFNHQLPVNWVSISDDKYRETIEELIDNWNK